MASVERLAPARVVRSVRRRWFAYRELWPAPWRRLRLPASDAVVCNICRWSGDRFEGIAHSESAICERCGSITRDRFLHLAMGWRRRPRRGERVLETSPRLGGEYRTWMGHHFRYLASDFDASMHKADIQLDLQAIDLPDASVDLILTPHVLEHVPDTDAALDELRRILAPGGRLVLQVPVDQAVTAPPSEPEFHADNTPVFWRFGYDLTDRLRTRDWDVHALCTEPWAEAVAAGRWPEDDPSTEFDVAAMIAGAPRDDFEVAVDAARAKRLGLEPAYQLLTWVCDVPRR